MGEDEFWGFVARLGGVADSESCRALDAELRAAGRGADFLDTLDEHVRHFLRVCPLPEDFWGDSAEWLAAAVVAGGRAVYEDHVSSGRAVDPDAWDWDDAEALLVAGLDPDPEPPPPPAAEHVSLQWNAERVPEGVTTTWEPWTDESTGPHDDPASGRSVVTDPEWDAALRALGAGFRPAQHLALVVRDLPEAETLRWPEHGQVVRRLPVELVLASGSRRELYVAELRALADRA